MPRAMAIVVCVLSVLISRPLLGKDEPIAQPEVQESPFGQVFPRAAFDQPPTLNPVAPRMAIPPAFPPVADPRLIFFDPYFFPTHYNFRPLPYGYPPVTPGFFYGALANPYYYQYYGPGEYYGF